MIEVAALAGSIVSSFLLPVAKETLRGIRDKVADASGEAAGTEAANLAQRVWNRVRDAFRENDAEATELLDRFELDPDDGRIELERRLAEMISRDKDLLDELAGFMSQKSASAELPVSQLIGHTVGQVNIRGDMYGGEATGVKVGSETREPPARR
jgi:hypothetical protein